MNEKLTRTLEKIFPISPEDLDRAQRRLDSLTKPPGSLGRLEELGRRYAAIKGLDSPKVGKKAVYVFAADHGVAAEGVSAYPAEVTPQMVMNFIRGGAAINVLARHVGAEVFVVDMGVNYDFEGVHGVIDKKIGLGTKNMLHGPSMTRKEAEEALQGGLDLANEAAGSGVDILAAGDMGIGNTTAASAVLAVLGEKAPEQVTGRGTGVDDAAFSKKVSVIEQAIHKNRPNRGDPLDVLAKIGGFEIGGIAGFILGAAASRTPVVVDGLISGAAAALAVKLEAAAADYIFTSHRSQEPGHDVFFQIIGQEPLFDFGMRLGEGTGAVLGMSLLEAGAKIYSEMATFESAGVAGKKPCK